MKKRDVTVFLATLVVLVQANIIMAADTSIPNKGEVQHSESKTGKKASVSEGSGDLASPVVTHITTRTRIRKAPVKSSRAFRILEEKEDVTVYGSVNGWLKVATKWKFDSGKPLIGYIWGDDIPRDVAVKVGVKFDEAKPVLASKGDKDTTSPSRVVSVVLPKTEPTIDVKPIVAAKEALELKVKELQAENRELKESGAKWEGQIKPIKLAKMSLENQVKVLQAENLKLKGEVVKDENESKGVRSALANASSRVKQIEDERVKLDLEVKSLRAQLNAANTELQAMRTGGVPKLLLLADSGEAVFFKGIGEARMAAEAGKSVLRFPLTASNGADRVLLGAKAEKHIKGAYVYYTMDSAGLVF